MIIGTVDELFAQFVRVFSKAGLKLERLCFDLTDSSKITITRKGFPNAKREINSYVELFDFLEQAKALTIP